MKNPVIMGIVNVTPDSFSGDGVLLDTDYIDRAVVQAEQMVADGASILDIGGESSRPGSVAVPAEEELRRVIPVITAIKKKLGAVTMSIDTIKAEVAAQAVRAGATIINDIFALAGDAAMASVVAQSRAAIVLMHNRSTVGAVSEKDKIGKHYDAPIYTDVVVDVAHDLRKRAAAALAAGIARDKIILDPGIGFGKTPSQNMALIKHLDRIKALGFPVLMGVSRKSFIGHALDVPIDERMEGTAACITACVLNGADILRVHDVKFMGRVVKMAAALRDA